MMAEYNKIIMYLENSGESISPLISNIKRTKYVIAVIVNMTIAMYAARLFFDCDDFIKLDIEEEKNTTAHPIVKKDAIFGTTIQKQNIFVVQQVVSHSVNAMVIIISINPTINLILALRFKFLTSI